MQTMMSFETPAEQPAFDHVWQRDGLGRAPFKFVDLISVKKHGENSNVTAVNAANEQAHRAAKAYGVRLCSCDHCGQSLLNNCVIRDADGKHFVVGVDCVRKTGQSELTTAAELAEKTRKREQARARAAAKHEAARLKRNAELEAQRERNGGLTDGEIAQKAFDDARQAEKAKHRQANQWIIDGLLGDGDFVMSMRYDLGNRAFDTMSDRCQNLIREIWAKQAGRKNSKAWQAKAAEFDARLG